MLFAHFINVNKTISATAVHSLHAIIWLKNMTTLVKMPKNTSYHLWYNDFFNLLPTLSWPKCCCCCGWLSSHVCVYPIPARVICIYVKYNETKKNIMQIFITYTISTPLNDKYFDYFHLHMWVIVVNKKKLHPSMYKLSTTLCYRLFLESNEFTSTHIDFATLLMRELIRITYWDYEYYIKKLILSAFKNN